METGARENDRRAMAVLAAALRSPGRATRRRAVAMLVHVRCDERLTWLEAATGDSDEGVRETALAVLAWVLPVIEPPWPEREACVRHGRIDSAEFCGESVAESVATRGGWEYAIEVWRSDGLLVGVYAVTTCEEDDVHARSIALGQAILANTGRRGDVFDPATAATFIVAKHERGPGSATREPPPRGRSDGRPA